ncbi:MAG: hypothetical protein H0U12_03195 [Thermoleophilaceae bacterium]|nr:hypothetical protein [Thermoleophilaceae bacterium]
MAARRQPRQRGLSAGREPRRFALDQNFPQPVLDTLEEYLRAEAELVPLARIDPRLVEGVDDWQIVLSLHQRGGWDGLITTDTGMLSLPRELAVLMQTKLTLVVAEEAGHDPLRATGLVLLHLPNVCRQTTSVKPQIWRLRAPRGQRHIEPWAELERVADHQNDDARSLYTRGKLSTADLARDPLNDAR